MSPLKDSLLEYSKDFRENWRLGKLYNSKVGDVCVWGVEAADMYNNACSALLVLPLSLFWCTWDKGLIWSRTVSSCN